jgi:hypothetical protein
MGDDVTGLGAFIIHAETVRRGDEDLVRRCVVEKGFEILLDLDISDDGRGTFAQWAETRLPAASISQAAAVLIAHDLLPIAPSENAENGFGRNDRDEIAMRAARNEVNRLPDSGGQYNPVSALRCSADAWSLLAVLAPDRTAEVRCQIEARAAEFSTPPPVSELSSVACRAKVELVEHNGALAVRKTFRPAAGRYLDRELAVFQQLGPACDAIPKLLEHGPTYLIMEYIDQADQLGIPDGEGLLPLPLKHVRELAAFVRTCVANGFDPIDLKPDGNAIFTRKGLKVIDYEFWRRCPDGTRPEDCYSLAGLPQDYAGDRPMGLSAPFRPYPTKWLPFTGLPVKSLLYDPPWLQRLKRLPWPAVAILRRAGRAGVRLVRGRGRADGSPR